ncbi:MAG: DUF2283 domain-containing protein [Gemmatimonadota bacterium]|nr:DUF2283 domain-containing protein [Gemmatimonadota bacterium]
MNFVVQVEPSAKTPAEVEYRWDADTDILTANCRPAAVGEGVSGSVELTGSDGSWVTLDIASGSISGVAVAVWPDVQKRSTLQPPAAAEDARVTLAPRRPPDGIAAFEVATALLAESDEAERTIHFRVGKRKPRRTVRIARDILIDVDESGRIAGVWLLNVPPFPAGT